MKIYLHKLTSSHTTIRNSQFHWLLCVRSCTRVDKCGISSNRFLRNDSERETQRESGKESSILLCEFHDVCRVNWMEWIDLIFVIQSDLNPLLLHHSSKWFSLHIKESILFLYFVCEHYFTYLGTTTSFSVIVIFLVDLLCVCVRVFYLLEKISHQVKMCWKPFEMMWIFWNFSCKWLSMLIGPYKMRCYIHFVLNN